MEMEYNVGRYLREHYIDDLHFLSPYYNRSEVRISINPQSIQLCSTRQIYVRSTDVDRTLQSAECELAGLYPSHTNIFNDTDLLHWQPIPVQTCPTHPNGSLCLPSPLHL